MSPSRVLLVEDDEGLRYALATALKRAGFDVQEASDGKDAVEEIDRHADEYCCVILDMLLPVIHGSSVLTHIARNAPHLAVVAVTGFPDRVLFADPSNRHVVKAIFTKPLDPTDLVAYLKSRCEADSRAQAAAMP